MKIGEQFIWFLRLLLFSNVRIHLHLPAKGYDRDNNWREFTLKQHMPAVQEIESYLADRFQGMSYETHWKNASGMWKGEQEKNTVFYIDLCLSVRDIEWFLKMKKIWASKERFNQHVIYIAIHPIWVLFEASDK